GSEHERDVRRGERDAAVDEPTRAPRVIVVDQTTRGARGDDRDARAFGEAPQGIPRTRDERPGAGEDHGARRRPEQVEGPVEVASDRSRPSILDEAALPRPSRWYRGGGEHVLRDLEVGDARRARASV